MVCPPIKDPNSIPRLKIPEKIDIATELVFSSVANIVATLNAVELVHHTIHIKENSEIKMNLFLFLLKFEDNILLPILQHPIKKVQM